MALAPEDIEEVKRLARAWRKQKSAAKLDRLADAVGEMAEEIEAGREVIKVAAQIREDGYTDALAKDLAAALRKLRASAFVWEEGDITFYKG